MAQASKKFLAASMQHCRWLPCPGSISNSGEDVQLENLPAVLAAWSEDAKQHALGVADVQLQLDTGVVHDCKYKGVTMHPSRFTDLQVAKWTFNNEDFLLAIASSSCGSLSFMFMGLPADLPGATTADLKIFDPHTHEAAGSSSSLLVSTSQLHQAPPASVDHNQTQGSVLSVAGDGSICIVPLERIEQASASDSTFKQASGWSGYSQGRWVDSHTFATAGVLGGLQLWDDRAGPTPTSRSSNSWGHTGCGLLDKQMGAHRQLLCLDVHPSRPNLAATGSSGGTVAIWDVRFRSAPLALTGAWPATGDVCQCKFDLHSPQSTAAVPPVLYCTLDGAFCMAQDAAAAAAAEAAIQGSSWGGDSSGTGGLAAELLHKEPYAICSFDVEPTYGRHILAATDDEHILLLQLDDSQQMQQF